LFETERASEHERGRRQREREKQTPPSPNSERGAHAGLGPGILGSWPEPKADA